MATNNGASSPPGTADYLPNLIARLRTAAPTLTLDRVIFQSVLLCIIAGERHLILRTKEEDVALVQRLATSLFTTVFGYPTQKVKIRSRQSPEQLLRALFLQPTSTLGSPPGSPWRPRPQSYRSFTTITSSQRSTSYLSEVTPTPTSASNPNGPNGEGTFPCPNSLAPSSSSQSVNQRPEDSEAYRNTAHDSSQHGSNRSRVGLGLSASVDGERPPTDLEPGHQHRSSQRYRHHRVSPSVSSVPPTTTVSLPQALVVSGLQFAGLPAQRELMKVIAEKRLVLDGDEGGGGTWNLPPNFILVYVCTLDERERPNVHNGLVDKFSMSSNVIIQHSTRESTTSRCSHSRARSDVNVQALLPSKPLMSTEELASLRELTSRVHIHPSLSIYASDLFAATRHHPELEGTLITARAHKDLVPLVCAHRVLCGDTTGTEFIQFVAAETRSEMESVYDGHSKEAPTVRTASTSKAPYESDIDDMTTVRVSLDWKDGHSKLGGASTGASGTAVEQHGVIEVGAEPEDGQSQSQPEVLVQSALDASETDVAQIVPRVLSHRLRVRNGPDDEILGSVMFGAVVPPRGLNGTKNEADDQKYERRTVKDILVQILADV